MCIGKAEICERIRKKDVEYYFVDEQKSAAIIIPRD